MQNDSLNGLQQHKHSPLPLLILSSFLVISLVFAAWAFMSRLDYKNNSDKKSDAAVSKALAEQKTKLDAEYDEKAKYPYVTYAAGDDEFGNISLSYPKNWSLYVDAKKSGATSSIDGYAHPDFVPSVTNDVAYALRFQVSVKEYSNELKTFESAVKTGAVKVEPFRPDKVQSVLGSKITGQISSKESGVIYLLPFRGKTIKVWTESNVRVIDLEMIIKTLTFSP